MEYRKKGGVGYKFLQVLLHSFFDAIFFASYLNTICTLL